MKSILIAAVALSAGAALADSFMAGFARADITPPLGTYMPGYYVQRRARQVLDPLEVNCLALSDGRTTAFVMQVDAMAVSTEIATLARKAVAEATGADVGAVLVHASHTHDGGHLNFVLRDDPNEEADGQETVKDVDRLYARLFVTRAADAAKAAQADLRPARLSGARTVATRISFGRRYLMKDGKVRTNPGTNNPDIVRPVGTPDEQVQVLRIDRDGAKPIAVINFQTHPDVVGGETITADWPGLTRRVFEAANGGDCVSMVINGTEGDVNHCNVLPRPGELNGLKRDFDDVDRGYDHAKHMANVLAGAALSVWMKCVPIAAGKIRFATEQVSVPANKAKESDEKNVAWAKKVWGLHEAGKDAELPWKGMELTTEVARAGRILKVAGGPDVFVLPITTVSVGKGVAFGGFPGEPFNDIGKAVKAKSPFAMTILSCLTNGSRGYFPFSDSYTQGGYESATSPFGPSVADDLIAGELRLLGTLCQ